MPLTKGGLSGPRFSFGRGGVFLRPHFGFSASPETPPMLIDKQAKKANDFIS